MLNTVILFDLDGVLIRPGGYRAALRATLENVYQRMGLNDPAPGNDVLDMLEAQGITNEWDMIALCVGVALEQAIDKRLGAGLSSDLGGQDALDEVLKTVQTWQLGRLEIDYSPLSQLSKYVGQKINPSAALLASAQRGEDTYIRRLLPMPGILTELFGNIEDPTNTPLTRLQQHFVIGSREFARAYHSPADFETPSFLEMHDQPLLESMRGQALVERWRTDELGMAAFTLRPSLPPRECANGQVGFTAEAELAVRLVGLAEIPLIGHGRVRYLAAEMGIDPEALTKPEPGHALGAILAGLTRQEWPALQAAGELLREGALPEGLWLPEFLDVHVFEDSPVGLRAAREAVELLRGQGIRVELHAWGIATAPEKIRALQAEGAQVFPDVNQALDQAFDQR